ncbi:hypothetical protein PoB_002301500 [Plakobranchus ocellatus]|uniref:Secreted protein n=1 Tax=Plakobranchus ocellatus TaxID=259542 RepID=A0AAV3ZN11_9GAST|nr:hypothetical protein PoB_002301500 [Plakobranchus ocellatus]
MVRSSLSCASHVFWASCTLMEYFIKIIPYLDAKTALFGVVAKSQGPATLTSTPGTLRQGSQACVTLQMRPGSTIWRVVSMATPVTTVKKDSVDRDVLVCRDGALTSSSGRCKV